MTVFGPVVLPHGLSETFNVNDPVFEKRGTPEQVHEIGCCRIVLGHFLKINLQ
jgi:hypothetical protein